MDMKKLYKKLIENENLKDIPAIYVLRVAVALLELVFSGECMKELDSCM